MPVRICPKCQSHKVHRSRRRTFFERYVLPLTLRRPFRCHGCNWRYYGFYFDRSVAPGGRRPMEPKPGKESEPAADSER